MYTFRTMLSTLLCLSLGSALAQAFPVTVEHKYGSTTISQAPERIVTLGFNDHDAVYAVGAAPIAVRYWFDDDDALYPWSEEAAAGTKPDVLNMTELNMEAILEFGPDLITAQYSGITQDEYRQLSEIAPTLAQSGDYVDYGMPWQEMTVNIGTALGEAEEAEAQVAEVEAAFAAAREEHPEFEGTSILVLLPNTEGGFYAYRSDENRSRAFTNLGFTVPEEIDELAGDAFYIGVSQERYDLLERDVLVLIATEETPESARALIEGDALLSQLEVVKDDRVVYVVQDQAQALGFNTVLSLPYALEGFLPDLSAAVARLEND